MNRLNVLEHDRNKHAELCPAAPTTGAKVRTGSHVRRIALAVALAAVASTGAANAQEPNAEGQFDCLIQPKMVLKLGTSVPGLLSEVLVDRGAVVKKGDVIAKLESGVEEAATALARARADNDSTIKSSRARRDFQLRKEERAKQLRKTDNIALSAADEAETAARIAESEYQEAEVNLQLARLDLARATEVLKQRTIRSPINGVVVERKLGPGEYAFDQAHLMTVSQIDPLNVEVYAYFGGSGIDQRSVGSYVNALQNRGQAELQREVGDLIEPEDNRPLLEFAESRCFDRNLIRAHRELRKSKPSVVPGRQGRGGVGFQVSCSDTRIRDNRVRRVYYGSDNGA